MTHGLFIDTSLRGLQMALIHNEGPQPEIGRKTTVPDNPGSSGQIGALLKQGLTHQGIQVPDLQSVIVGHGPGSFTGIKIGLSFAYGLVRACEGKLPCLGVSSLALISKQLARVENRFVQAALAATQSQGFLCLASATTETTTVVAMTQTMREMGLDEGRPVDFLEGWPAFMQNLEKSGLHGRTLATERWRVLLFDALRAEYAGMAQRARSMVGTALPEPNFMRYAAPVERQMQQTGELKV